MLLLSACGTETAPTATPATSGSTGNAGSSASGGLPKLAKKDKYKVGFSQTVSDNPWRLAETQSMKDEAAKRGWEIVVTDAGGSAAKQVADVDSLIAQKVDAIFLAPQEEKPLVPAVMKAKAAGIPVILLDRTVDQTQAQGGRDYITFIGSDFVEEGQRVAEWLIKKTGGTAKIIELEGTTGSSPANDRKKGFDDAIKSQSGMQILASQTGQFNRDKGREVMATLLQAHPDVTVVYAHNDEMAIGAIAALEAAGKKPGQDVTVVSVDGEKDGLQAIIDGKLGATCECSPRFGPKAFDTLVAYANGETIPPQIINPDNFFDATNAKDNIANSY
ncbi:MAG TPA: ABC transporter substrate-binding protein [Chloroflexia bacterium]|nr:ABC transporter substrate-binding protein [Chloroflexia bacterium]